MFEEIINQIIAEIVSQSRFTKEEIAKILMKSRDSNSLDFSMFLNAISKTPEDDAKELSSILEKIEIVKDVSLKKNSVSFNLNKGFFLKEMFNAVLSRGESFGTSSIGKGKRVVVDFSSPNIAKIFHVGHFRTTVLGNFVVRLLRSHGFDVVAMNYLGDWGKQFGLVLLGYERFGNEESLKAGPLNHLFEIYVKISALAKEDPSIDADAREIFRAMEEDKNENYMARWRMFRELSIEKYKELYGVLGIEFDVYSGESEYSDAACKFAKNSTVCTQDADGSYVIDCGKNGKALIQKSDGTTLYITRDIVAAIDRIERYNADLVLYVVGDEQNRHFEQLFECLGRLGYDKNKFRHINYGMIKGMSTRNGNVHFLEDVITNSAAVIKEKLLSGPKEIEDRDRTARILAVSTLLYADFGAKRIKGYSFDIEKRANCQTGSAAYLQYTHCRILSIETKNKGLISDTFDVSLVSCPFVEKLAYDLIWYEHLSQLTLADYEPSRIALYLMDIAKIANSLIEKMKVLGVEEELGRARLAVLRATRIVINNGLRVLGMEPLERM